MLPACLVASVSRWCICRPHFTRRIGLSLVRRLAVQVEKEEKPHHRETKLAANSAVRPALLAVQ